MPRFSFTFSGDTLEELSNAIEDFLDNADSDETPSTGAPATAGAINAETVKDAIAEASGKKRGRPRKPKVDAPAPIAPPASAVAAAAPGALAAALGPDNTPAPAGAAWMAPGSDHIPGSPFAPSPLGPQPPAPPVSSAMSPFGAPPLGQHPAPVVEAPELLAARSAITGLIDKHGATAVMAWLSKSLGRDLGTDAKLFLGTGLSTFSPEILKSIASAATAG